MAEVIRKATNKFTKGLVMDFSPENTRNEVLTHALNATLLTFNGNELSLQNDMGNARVESAYLPEGYIPVGTCEYGGIIYIVSYNPLEDKSQIGCFPSPERNVSSDELGISDCLIDKEIFQSSIGQDNSKILTGDLPNTSQCVILRNDKLNPGDKFIVTANDSLYNEAIKDLFYKSDNANEGYLPVEHPRIALNVVSIEDSGKIIYLNSEIRQYQKSQNGTGYSYHLLGNVDQKGNVDPNYDIDSYRNVVSSGYSVFRSKTSGKLAILAELVTIDSFSVTHGLQPRLNELGKVIEGRYDVMIYTDVTPEVTADNYLTVPKLAYYQLKESQGYLQNFNANTDTYKTEMFVGQNGDWMLNPVFTSTKLSDIYAPTVDRVVFKETLGKSGKFNFPKPNTYHGNMESCTDLNSAQFTKLSEDKFHRVTYSQLCPNQEIYSYFRNDLQVKIYKYDASKEEYTKFEEDYINSEYTYYTKKQEPVYTKADPQISRDVQLYKITSTPTIATPEIKSDTTIEKFQYRDIEIHRLATEEEIEARRQSLWEKIENGWREVLVPSIGNTYYIKEDQREIVSIGFDPNYKYIFGNVYYYPNEKNYVTATPEEKDLFYSGDPNIELYYVSNVKDVYEEASLTEINEYVKGESELYYNSQYILIPPDAAFDQYKNTYPLFVVSPMDAYVPIKKFTPNYKDNYIAGETAPDGNYPKDDPLYLYTLSDFIPTPNNNYTYSDITLAGIKFPNEVMLYNLDLPFKYDYTIVPCMDYGRLDSLAVSNTVDFSKLHLFDQSNFTIWKYHIDGNQLRLTFGAEIYDTYEVDKVDGLVLEFYDLWGFAGSLEISNKKAYSGVFTKIIPLNTLNALSKKKISGSETLELFKRNTNIKPQDDKLMFNSKEVVYADHIQGWIYKDSSQPLTDSDNDCGVLFSNLVYGVKTYLKMRKSDGTTDYIPKKELFLFTIPIYNEQYYNLDNFDLIENPKLDMVLTYKLVDNGHKVVYDKGYNNYDDSVKIADYLGGAYNGTSLEVTKYYKYYGITDLYLEVGLKKEYSDIGMGYSPLINKYFSCDLQLMSNEDENKTLSITSSENTGESITQLLCYNKVGGEPDETQTTETTETPDGSEESVSGVYTQYDVDENCRIGFGDQYANTKTMSTLHGYNFLNNISEYNTPIPICYSFVVGYKINVTDIRASKIPMTTLCALYHQDDSGIVNDYDFGIYTITNTTDGITTTKYLSDVLFYNCGDEKEEVFGVCKQITDIGSIEDQCTSMDEVRTPATVTTTAGKLNSGNPLNQLKSYIGKLTFGQPHIHGFGDAYRTNINNDRITVSGDGIVEAKANRYHFCANTKSSIDYNSEFISLIQIGGEGIFGTDLSDYNEKLLKTMSEVYVYNPDYDTFDIKVGDISIQDKKVQFISNLISRNAKFDFTQKIETEDGEEIQTLALNNFIYIGPTDFATYLDYLNKHSQIKITSKSNNIETILGQVNFTPNYTYCGSKSEAYLISTLTYNTPIPTEVTEELSFQASNLFAVRKHNGDTIILEGNPNKKTLYGLHETKTARKIYNLDVSNYRINTDGTLTFVNTFSDTETSLIYFSIPEILGSLNSNGGYEYTETLQGTKFYNLDYTTKFIGETNADTVIYDPNNNRVILFIKKTAQTSNLTYQIYPTMPPGTNHPSANPNTWTTNTSSVKIQPTGIVADVNSKILDSTNIWTAVDGSATKIRLEKQTPYVLYMVTLSQPTQITYSTISGKKCQKSSDLFWNGISQDKITGGENAYGVGWGYNGVNISLKDVPMDKTVICSISINQLTAVVTRNGSIHEVRANILNLPTTNVDTYVDKKTGGYLLADGYTRSALCHTTITLNDLLYEPNIEGHRLYLRRTNKWASRSNLPIYYRQTKYKAKDANKDYNKLIPFIGPTLV